jgi:hypothetical protein
MTYPIPLIYGFHMKNITPQHKKHLLTFLKSKEIEDVRQGLQLLESLVQEDQDLYDVFDLDIPNEIFCIDDLESVLSNFIHVNPIRIYLIGAFAEFKTKWILETSTIVLVEGKLNDVTADEFDTFLQQIQALKRLKILHLFNNPLTTLPESIGQLTSLMALTIGQNRLTALPESIGNLTSLKHLLAGDNQLTCLPKSMAHLQKMEELTLSRNQLTLLPEFIGQFNQLQSLFVNDNYLTAIPKSIAVLPSLHDLTTQGNKIIDEM